MHGARNLLALRRAPASSDKRGSELSPEGKRSVSDTEAENKKIEYIS